MADRALRLTLEQVASIAALLADGSPGQMELETPRGRFQVALSRPHPATGTAHVLTAPAAGTFLTVHPHRSAAMVTPGQTVQPGAVVALIQIGPLLVPVTWDAASPGVLARPIAEAGALVGFGTGLLEMRVP